MKDVLSQKSRFLFYVFFPLSVFTAIAVFFIAKKSIGKSVSSSVVLGSDLNKVEAVLGIGQKEQTEDLTGAIITEEGQQEEADEISGNSHPLHKNISATVFWVGEKASDDNKEISNKSSAWDDYWRDHYGGTDDPDKRKGFYPAKFTPKENPFYFALPYNDFDINGNRRGNSENIYWANEKKWDDNESMVKNRWIKIIHENKTCYGQWEDVGPFKENDFEYVFGNNDPKSRTNRSAGLDISPALKDCLGLKDLDKVAWQFVDFENVPDGPWKKIITSSGIDWK
jgi:hypothetical protein